jgi:hypothetical protein
MPFLQVSVARKVPLIRRVVSLVPSPIVETTEKFRKKDRPNASSDLPQRKKVAYYVLIVYI